MLFAGFILVYIPGLVQLYLWLSLVKGQAVSLYQLLGMGFLPFIVGDVIKALVVAGIAWGLTPKQTKANGEAPDMRFESVSQVAG